MPLSDPWVADPTVPAFAAPMARVYRYDPDVAPDPEAGPDDPPPSPWTPLPNVRCWRVERREGTDPGAAWFGYALGYRLEDGTLDPASPQAAEQALDTSWDLPRTVREGDRLVVKAARPSDGQDVILFDGYATGFHARLSASAEEVPIVAVGIARRCWDRDIPGAMVRDADDPDNDRPTTSNVQTDLPARFNPGGRANATAELKGHTPEGGSTQYPVFLDPDVKLESGQRRAWTLGMAARYLCYHHNYDQEFVALPPGPDLEALLVSRVPVDPAFFDPSDPDTYTTRPIACPDTPITGRDWPTALSQLVRPYGFAVRFDLVTLPDGTPETRLVVARQQDGPVKDLWLQPRGSGPLDLAYTNVAAADLGRDIADVANEWLVEGHVDRYEASVVLAPGFPSDPADAAGYSSIAKFDASDEAYKAGAGRDKYRLYVYDECGEGHYAAGSATKLTAPGGFSTIFNPDLDPDVRTSVRRRPGIGRLFSVDPKGRPLEARLSISTDYSGAAPAPWDGTGTWQPVAGGWQLLRDRLGIWISTDNPNRWNVGESAVSGHPFRTGIVRAVERQAAAGQVRFQLRLTCVIEGDRRVAGRAARRPEGSPLGHAVRRRVDAGDRYFRDRIAAKSEFNPGDDPVAARDDSDAAEAEAVQLRAATEAGVLEGSATVPWLTTYYRLGDRVRSLAGRGLGLRTDGSSFESRAVYPVVVGIAWDLRDGQSTHLMLSDADASRHALERRISRKREAI